VSIVSIILFFLSMFVFAPTVFHSNCTEPFLLTIYNTDQGNVYLLTNNSRCVSPLRCRLRYVIDGNGDLHLMLDGVERNFKKG
jgi:hypothetical protein